MFRLLLNLISRYGSNVNQFNCNPHAIFITPGDEWTTMFECEPELHIFNKWLTDERRALCRNTLLTYANIKLYFACYFFKMFRNVADLLNSFKLHFLFLFLQFCASECYTYSKELNLFKGLRQVVSFFW